MGWLDFDLQDDLAEKAGPIVSAHTWHPFSAFTAHVEEMCLPLHRAFPPQGGPLLGRERGRLHPTLCVQRQGLLDMVVY